MDRSAEEILDDLRELGTMPTTLEVVALCEAVAEGELAAAKFTAFERALGRAGWTVLDVTTDDDDTMAIELVPPPGRGR